MNFHFHIGSKKIVIRSVYMRTDLVLEQNVVSYVRTFLGMYTTARSLLSITYLSIYDTYVLGWRWAL